MFSRKWVLAHRTQVAALAVCVGAMLGVISLPGYATGGSTHGNPDPAPGMPKVHGGMVDCNPGMARMHGRMTAGTSPLAGR